LKTKEKKTDEKLMSILLVDHPVGHRGTHS